LGKGKRCISLTLTFENPASKHRAAPPCLVQFVAAGGTIAKKMTPTGGEQKRPALNDAGLVRFRQ
jgi:hypothetical protein